MVKMQFNYKQQETGSMSEFLKEFLGLQNIAYTISTACSSSGKAFASATRLIEQNICDVVLVGGCDTLCELTLNGFDCLEAISQDICQPFSINRNGINIGEGSALFILSKEPSEVSLMGIGESSDGYHITAPEPNGLGAIFAMESALNKAQLEPKQIGYLNLHGTATNLNDAMESNAVKTVFDSVDCSSTKYLTGHTLGAAAATEVAMCWLLLSNHYNPSQNLPKQNVSIETLSTNIGIITEDTTYENPYFMSNSFAFGGSNASVIIGRKNYV
jgi:3-oxoacyl-[acyl-carrier-protein] synthase-1